MAESQVADNWSKVGVSIGYSVSVGHNGLVH